MQELSRNIIAVEPTLDSVIEGLREAVKAAENLENRKAFSSMNLPSSWDEAFEKVLPRAMGMWRECHTTPAAMVGKRAPRLRTRISNRSSMNDLEKGTALYLRPISLTRLDRTDLTLFLFLGYAFLQFLFYVVTLAITPDEINFIQIAEGLVPYKIFHIQNIIGYGSLFWILLAVLTHLPLKLVCCRLFYWLLYLSIFPILAQFIRDGRARFLALLFWLSLPSSFWYGKIVGPVPRVGRW